MAQLGSLALDGGDPRLPGAGDEKEMLGSGPVVTGIQPHQRKLHDPSVTFEEYHYYAQLTRAEEDSHPKTGHETKLLSLIFPSKADGGVQPVASGDHKIDGASISDAEWTNASRALRTATRGAIFYLITTDILGPFALPYAFATMGWGSVGLSTRLAYFTDIYKQTWRCSLHCLCWPGWLLGISAVGYVHGFRFIPVSRAQLR
jgi:hypothetical protein